MLWRTLVCCLVLAGTVSAIGWEPWVHYQYAVDIRTLTALPDVAQVYTGTLLKLKVDLKSITETEFSGKITIAKDASINPVHLRGGWLSSIPQESVQYQQLPVSRRAFHVLLNADGTVKDIYFEPGVKDWEKALTTGMVEQWQLAPYAYHQKKQLFANPPVSKDSKFAVFHTTEKSLLGECDALYHINPLTPAEALLHQGSLDEDLENYLVVIKSWNLTNCKRMNKFTMGLSDPKNFEAGGNAQLPISRSIQSRALIKGDLKNFTITEVETNSTFIVPPQLYNKQKSMVMTNFKATLISKIRLASPPVRPRYVMKDKRSAAARPQASQPSMKKRSTAEQPDPGPYMRDDEYNPIRNWHVIRNYVGNEVNDQDYRWAPNAPLPYQMGSVGRRIGDTLGRNISIVLVTLAEDISQMLHNQTQVLAPEILSRVIVGVKHMRTMFVEEILAAHAIILQREQETGNPLPGKVLRNIAALTGTTHSLQAMFSWLVKDDISLEEFIQHFSMQKQVVLLPTIYYLETMRQITLLVEKIEKPDQQALESLRATVALTFTDILRLAGRKHKKLTESVVDYYITVLEEGIKSNNSEKVQLVIRLLGNIGSLRIWKPFHDIIIGAWNVTEHVRLHALVSLDWVTTLHPNSMHKFYWSVFANTTMPCKLRCQAVPGIMRSNPPAWMLQQMAESTHNETNPHVRAQVSSAIKSAATLRGPFNEQLARNARAAVSFLKPEVFDASYSAVIFDSYKIDGMDLSYSQLLNYIGSQDSLLPSSVQYSVYKNYNGYRPLEFQASGMVTSVNDTLEAIMQALFQPHAYSAAPSILDESEDEFSYEVFASGHKIPPTPFKDIYVQKRSNLEGNINIPGYGFWSFDRESLQKEIAGIIQKLDGSSRPVDILKISNARELMFSVPDGIGFTYIYTYTSLYLTNISGTVQLQKNVPLFSKSSPLILKAEGNINVTFAMREESKVGFITPWNSLDYMNGLDTNSQVYAPINVSIAVALSDKKDHVKVSADVGLPKNLTNILHCSSVPYVTTLWLLGNTTTTIANPNTTLLHSKPPVTSNHTLGKDFTGMAVNIEYYSETEDLYTNYFEKQPQYIKDKSWWSAVYRWLYQITKGHNVFSLIHFPFAARDIHISNFNITYDPQESTADSAQFYWEIGVPDPRVYKVLANASFVGEKAAVFGLQGAVHTSWTNQSLSSTVKVWSEPAVDEPLDAEAEMSLQIPPVEWMNFEQTLSGSPNSSITAAVTITRPSWPKPAILSLTGILGRTPQREEYIRESPESKACLKQMESEQYYLPICQNVTKWANSLDAYELSIVYRNIPVELKRLTYYVYSGIRQALYPQIQEDPIHVNPYENKVSLGLYINNQSTAFNVSLQSSLMSANATSIPLPSWARPLILNADSSLSGRVGQQLFPLSFSPSFVVDTKTVVTFDGNSYPMIQSNCWFIALAYTPKWRADAPADEHPVYKYENLRDLVLIRRTKDGLLESTIRGEGVVIEVLGQQHTPTPKVVFNAEEIIVNKEQPTDIGASVVTYILPNGAIALYFYESPIEYIYQDSHRIQIIPSESMRESASGLSGNFDGDSQNDFLVPKGCVMNDAEAFQAEWADCKLPQKESKCVYIHHSGVPNPRPPQPSVSCSSESSESEEETLMDIMFPLPVPVPAPLPIPAPVPIPTPVAVPVPGRNPEFEIRKSTGSVDAGISPSGAGVKISPPEFEAHIGHPTVVYKTDVQHFDDVTCFSTNPIPKCIDGLILEEGLLMNINYHCMPNGPLTQIYEETISEIEHKLPIKHKKALRLMSLLVPSKCKNP